MSDPLVRQRATLHRIAVEEACPNPPADDHEHCPLHGCVEFVCCVPKED